MFMDVFDHHREYNGGITGRTVFVVSCQSMLKAAYCQVSQAQTKRTRTEQSTDRPDSATVGTESEQWLLAVIY